MSRLKYRLRVDPAFADVSDDAYYVDTIGNKVLIGVEHEAKVFNDIIEIAAELRLDFIANCVIESKSKTNDNDFWIGI